MSVANGRAIAGAIAGLAILTAPTSLGAVAGDGAEGSQEGRGARLWQHLRHGSRLIGDPGGARSQLAALGVQFDAFFNHFVGWKLRGGAEPDDVLRQSGTYDVFARADFEELGLVPGLEALLHFKGGFNRNINPAVAALSDPVDDADGDDAIWIPELWAQQTFLDDRARLRLGYMDQQTVLDRNAYANSEDRQFMATFLDNNPVIPLEIGLGATLLLNPTDWLAVVVGTADADNDRRKAGFDTAFDGAGSLMGYFEADFALALPGGRGPLSGSYRLGLFLDGSKRPVFGSATAGGAPAARRGHLGGYLSFDQLVFREDREGLQGLGVFARWGLADPDVNAIEQFWSVGLEYRGALPGRDDDLFAVGVFQALGSDRFRDDVDPEFDRETGVECYYRIELTPWLTLTPDVQFIANPGGRRSARNAVALIWRTRVTF